MENGCLGKVLLRAGTLLDNVRKNQNENPELVILSTFPKSVGTTTYCIKIDITRYFNFNTNVCQIQLPIKVFDCLSQ